MLMPDGAVGTVYFEKSGRNQGRNQGQPEESVGDRFSGTKNQQLARSALSVSC